MAEQMVRVRNTSDRKISVSWDGTPYELEAGASDVLPEVVGNHFGKYHDEAVDVKPVEARYEEPSSAGRDQFTDPETGRTFDTMTEFVAFIEERARLGVVQVGAEAREGAPLQTPDGPGVLKSPTRVPGVVETPGVPAGGGGGAKSR